MTLVKSDGSLSISRDSAIDWSSAKGGMSVDKSDKDEDAPPPPSRYDPSSVHRISDIHDLVDDDDTIDTVDREFARGASAEDVYVSGGKYVGQGSSRYWKQSVVLISLFAIIIGATLAMGYAVSNRSSNNLPKSGPTYAVALNVVSPQESSDDQAAVLAQDLLEMAERIAVACDEYQLDIDMAACHDLCEPNSNCCLENGDGSCFEDESKHCAVFAGCQALMY